MTKKTVSVLLALCLLAGLALPAAAATPTFTDVASAAAYLRGELLARENRSVTVRFNFRATANEIGEMTGSNMAQFFDAAWEEIERGAYADTGAGEEGDYLKEEMYHSSCQESTTYASSWASCQFTYYANFYTNAEEAAALTAAIASALEELDLEEKSDYEKVCAITEYMCDRVDYDYENLNNENYMLKYSAYAAMIDGKAVCEGYTRLFRRMAKNVGLDVRTVNGGNHAWNIVRVDGLYYYHDVTWIDGQSTGRRCANPYFLKGSEDFPNHTLSASSIALVAAKGHHIWNEGAVTTPATSETEGVMTYTCTVCGTKKTEPIPCLCSHVPDRSEETVTAAPDCTHPGEKTVTVYCSVCGDPISETTQPIPAKGHTPGAKTESVIQTPTCYQEGEKRIVVRCAVCGDPVSETTQPTAVVGHKDDDNNGACDFCGASFCRFCHKVHSNDLFGRITSFFHRIVLVFRR